ncbi:MAG TPA: hypothetical protein VHC39_00585 [Rhizomicrobium sp.]|nr:hypothetical protein [Rhizomicrobium sp.]
MTPAAQIAPVIESEELCDQDRDSLHTLPISILPVETQIFRRARMVKNSRLESVIEFFSGAGCGRGQLDVRGVAKFLALEQVPPHPDVRLLKTVGTLPSFDVYSLRILLRQNAIAIADSSALTLSASKVASLSSYMARFTRPLVSEIFGHDTEGADFRDILSLFRADNAEAVRDRLSTMANRLGIPIEAIPKFLEDYGDIFMSLSYYRQCLDQILPQVQTFMDGVAMVRANRQLSQDQSLMQVVGMIEATINGQLSSITGKIESFERSTNDMWRDLTADKFKKIEALILHYHTSIGGALCALSVKMRAWSDQFPSSSGGVGRRAAFIMSDMRQGIEHIQAAQDDAPLLSVLNG